MKILSNNIYLLLIDEEAKIKGTVCLCYNSIKNTWDEDIILYQGTMPDYHSIGFQKILAYYPLTKEAKELDLPLLPNPFEDKFEELFDTVDNIKVRYSTEESDLWVAYRNGFKDCFEAQSKQFSLEDMISFASFCNDNHSLDDSGGQWDWQPLFSNVKPKTNQQMFEDWKQSLSTQKLPKEFIPNYGIPFITNLEGKQELVGKYIYHE